ncbi:MAG: adenylosuccinate synthetase [Azospirillaceae bacterium]
MITIVVGGQYGGEGKGKVCAFLARNENFEIVCRCGGINSSHTIVQNDRAYRFRMLPTAVSEARPKIVFGPGSLLHIPTLLKEMSDWNVHKDDVLIDPLAGIVSEECIKAQRQDSRYQTIGSTLTGTGYATAERAKRRLKLARDYQEISAMLGCTRNFLYRAAEQNKRILLEGHQGALLSNYHGDYPFTSSRDSTAAAMLSEVGLGLRWKYDVVLVIKAFETRNHVGKLRNEIAADKALRMGIKEVGGGSWGIADRARRVGMFDHEVLQTAVQLNTPNRIALTGVDYLFPSMKDATSADVEVADFETFLKSIQGWAGVAVEIVTTGPETASGYYRAGSTQNNRAVTKEFVRSDGYQENRSNKHMNRHTEGSEMRKRRLAIRDLFDY